MCVFIYILCYRIKVRDYVLMKLELNIPPAGIYMTIAGWVYTISPWMIVYCLNSLALVPYVGIMSSSWEVIKDVKTPWNSQ
jgi:hypothetical protein